MVFERLSVGGEMYSRQRIRIFPGGQLQVWRCEASWYLWKLVLVRRPKILLWEEILRKTLVCKFAFLVGAVGGR